MIRIEDILEKAESYCGAEGLDLLHRAYVFSARAHKDQTRRSGEPYLIHPLEVANLLVDLRLDAPTVATGLLHDVLEDTLSEPAKLRELFGPDVAHMVEGVTKIGKMEFTSREAEQAQNFRKMLLAMVDDIRVVLVKLADRLHNMRTLEHLPDEKRRRIAAETLDIYAPIAHRLGMGRVKGELEDLAFRYLWPDEYGALERALIEKRRVTADFIVEVRTRLTEACRSHGIDAEIDGRVKRLYSIWQKIQRQSIQVDEVYDYLAFRVITSSIRDCYGVLGVVHGTWTPIPGRIKDYIAMPKPNLYQSLHTSLMSEQGTAFEVQIRTRDMHVIAEDGIAAHWAYKEGGGVPSADARTFAWLRGLVELGKDVKDPREFLDSLKVDLYPDEVYAFTPKGKVLSFPRGSTAVDFAYGIHTEVGHQCVGARVNGKLVPIRTALRNGDIVEILRDKAHRPSRDWLKMVVTSRARNKIRQFLNNEASARALEIGKTLLEKELRRARLRPHLEEAEAASLLLGLGLAKLDDLYRAVGYGKVEPRHVAQKLDPDRVSAAPSPRVEAKPSPARASSDGAGIEVRGHGDVMVLIARCCKPIPGDRIVGYISRGRGVSVHAADCHNVKHLLFDPERRIDVRWAGQEAAHPYQVGLQVITEDHPGILAKISTKIAGLDANIKNVDARTSADRRGLIKFTLEIADLSHLEAILQAIGQVKGVLRVTRTVH